MTEIFCLEWRSHEQNTLRRVLLMAEILFRKTFTWPKYFEKSSSHDGDFLFRMTFTLTKCFEKSFSHDGDFLFRMTFTWPKYFEKSSSHDGDFLFRMTFTWTKYFEKSCSHDRDFLFSIRNEFTLVLSWAWWKALGVIGSARGLVGLVSICGDWVPVCCDCVLVWLQYADSFSVWQHATLSMHVYLWDTLHNYGLDVNQPRNNFNQSQGKWDRLQGRYLCHGNV